MSIYFYDSSSKPDTIQATLNFLFSQRRLIWKLAQHEVFLKYKRSVLGILWSFLNPVLISAVIFFVFGRIFNGYLPNQRGYAGYIYTGILMQVLVIQGIALAGQSIPQNLNLILKLRVQPCIFAVSGGVSQVIHLFVGLIGLIPIFIFYGQAPSLKILLLPIFFVLSSLCFAGISMLLAGLFVKFDDTAYLLNAFLMIFSYLSPILYPIDILEGIMRKLVLVNPITSWIMVFRWMIFENQEVYVYSFVIVVSTSVFFFILGIKHLNTRWKEYVMYI